MDILRHVKHDGVKYASTEDTVMGAMRQMVDNGVGSLVVKDSGDRVVGFLTQRDLLRTIVSQGKARTDTAEPTEWNVKVGDAMTPSKDLVFLTPNDSLEDARALMSVSGKRHIPVLSSSTLLGVISPKDIARCLHLSKSEVRDQSAKTSYVSTVMPRKGMPLGTRVQLPIEDQFATFSMRSAVANLPHPHKQGLGEDAYLLGPHMVGVADGVGSWWEHGVDPATYARALMEASRGSCRQQKEERELKPQHVLNEAWHTVQSKVIAGSCTVCLVALHPFKPELLAANVGDSGFILLRRHKPSAGLEPGAVKGALDTYAAPAPESSRHHHVTFRSPQQLRAFNAPYQLGKALDRPADVYDDRFETPQDASLVRVPIRGGDLVVLATDGLFDNMNEEQVLDILEECEATADPSLGASEEALALRLAQRAQELSLDRDVDSPFAILAKENDICWGGGRPDDITVLVMRVIDHGEHGPPPSFAAFAGPGPAPGILKHEEEHESEAQLEG